MIDITQLTDRDIGRGVVYVPGHNAKHEDGIIRSWNESYVFVEYSGSRTPKATRPGDLVWLSEGP